MSWNPGWQGGYPGGYQGYGGQDGYPGASCGRPEGGYAPPPGPPPGTWEASQGGYAGGPFAPPPGPPPGWGAEEPSGTYYQPPMGPPPAAYNERSGQPHAIPSEVLSYGTSGEQHTYQLSHASGRKKGLFIGCNYPGTSAELSGCHNDARNIMSFLIEKYGFRQEDCVILLDSPGADERTIPTKSNILRAMSWLVSGAQADDSLVFHFSGHGGQTEDLDGDEVDGDDETIYPTDYKTAGHIEDDEMHEIMVASLPRGAGLMAIFDCCHSGSALDLPFMYGTDGELKRPQFLTGVPSDLISAGVAYASGNAGDAVSVLKNAFSNVFQGYKAEQRTKKDKFSEADVVSLSGCKDTGTSADAVQSGTATGAMSWALVNVLTPNPTPTYQELLVGVRKLLHENGYEQKPQLSCSHPLDTDMQFVL